MQFNILKKGQRVITESTHPLYEKDVFATIPHVISPTSYIVTSDEIEIQGYTVVLTYTLNTEFMYYETVNR